MKRRNVLRSIGGATAGGLAISGKVRQSKNPDEDSQFEINEVTDSELAWELSMKTRFSSEFYKIASHLTSVEKAEVDLEEPEILEVINHDESSTAYIVMYNVYDLLDTEVAGISTKIVDGEVQEVIGTGRSVRNMESVQVEKFSVSNGVQTQSNQDTGVKHTSLNKPISTSESGKVTTQDCWIGDCPSKCDICKAVFETVRTISCGVPVGGICTAAGFVSGGAVLSTCALIVPAVCKAFSEAQNAAGITPKAACSGSLAPGGENGDLLYCE